MWTEGLVRFVAHLVVVGSCAAGLAAGEPGSIFSGDSAGEGSPSLQAPLTLADVESLALANNPTLRQATARVQAARGIREQAGLYPNPVIGYEGVEIGNEGRAGQQGGFVGQEIVTGGKLRLARAVADQEVEQARWLLEAQRQRVLNAVQARYYEAVAAQRSLALAEELLQVAERARHTADELFRAGQEARPAMLQAEIELDQARILLENARNRQSAAWRQLAAVVATELEPRPLEDTLEVKIPLLEWDEVWQPLTAASPELQVASAGIRRAELALRRARAQVVPNVMTQAGILQDTATEDTIAEVQLSVEVPIFNRNQGNIRAAHAELHLARAEVRRVELALRHRLAAAFERYANSRQQAEAYHDRIVPNARENLDLSDEGYRRGEFEYLELLTAQRAYFQSNLAYVDALANLWRSVVEIRGLLLTDGLGESG